METARFDVIVVGAGIAGAATAAALSPTHRVALLEAEEAPGYHTTGRSAAMWILNYGPPDVQVLTGLSRPFFEQPPAGFTEVPLLRSRPMVYLAPPGQEALLHHLVSTGAGVQPLAAADLRRMVPALRPDYATAAAIERDAFDLDVAAIHGGFLRQTKAHGGLLVTRSRTQSIERRQGEWEIRTLLPARLRAPVIVNAAGAWGDEVAAAAGVAPLGLAPCRRTGVIIDPAPWHVAEWPLLGDVAHSWYIRPEARTRLMATPCDETPVHPHDVQAEELDIALAIDRMQQAVAIDVRRVERAWAGLRTFTPDRNLAFGWDAEAPGFMWCVGQGGYGIQTSAAAGQLVAALVAGRDPGPAARIVASIDPARFRARTRAA
ncbi:MAG: FAD-binding oxidoreductase [Acetobacteraceae bacterium]|nr:FAD-binding oxidoreductase [Acetobacteraceae bacterium]